jgi:hypothetical protein
MFSYQIADDFPDLEEERYMQVEELLFYFVYLFISAYAVWAISLPYPPPLPSPPTSLPSKICSVLISNFVEEKT